MSLIFMYYVRKSYDEMYKFKFIYCLCTLNFLTRENIIVYCDLSAATKSNNRPSFICSISKFQSPIGAIYH